MGTRTAAKHKIDVKNTKYSEAKKTFDSEVMATTSTLDVADLCDGGCILIPSSSRTFFHLLRETSCEITTAKATLAESPFILVHAHLVPIQNQQPRTTTHNDALNSEKKKKKRKKKGPAVPSVGCQILKSTRKIGQSMKHVARYTLHSSLSSCYLIIRVANTPPP